MVLTWKFRPMERVKRNAYKLKNLVKDLFTTFVQKVVHADLDILIVYKKTACHKLLLKNIYKYTTIIYM
jgi:hypothetical protein